MPPAEATHPGGCAATVLGARGTRQSNLLTYRRRLAPMSQVEPTAELEISEADEERDFGAELNDDELGELLIREITIDGMCGVY